MVRGGAETAAYSAGAAEAPAWFAAVAAQERARQAAFLQRKQEAQAEAQAQAQARMAAEYEARRAAGRWVRFENQEGVPFYWHTTTGGVCCLRGVTKKVH